MGGGDEDDFLGGKATKPLQKEKQSKNQIKQKKKKRAKSQAVTTMPAKPYFWRRKKRIAHELFFGRTTCGNNSMPRASRKIMTIGTCFKFLACEDKF